MNQMTAALKSAGVKVPPVIERVWRYVADHPGVTSRTVSQVLGLKQSEASSQLVVLVHRRMCCEKKQVLKVRAGKGWTNRLISHYSVCIPNYELLPLPKVPPPVSVNIAKITEQVKPLSFEVWGVPAVQPEPGLGIDILSMPLGQARELYERLKRVFEGGAV